MSNQIVPLNDNPLQFLFENHPIRIAFASDNEPVFIASDVCRALDIANVSQALSRLDDDEKTDIILNDVAGRPQKQWCVTESGLYTLILSSRKPEVKAFKRWVTHEVLPSIRKTSGYEVPRDLTSIEKARHMLNIMVAIQDTVEAQQHLLSEHGTELHEHSERIASLEAHVQPESEYFISALGYFRYRNITAPSNE